MLFLCEDNNNSPYFSTTLRFLFCKTTNNPPTSRHSPTPHNRIPTMAEQILLKIFLQKRRKKFGWYNKNLYFCTRIYERASLRYTRLGYGVMVTLQILVLPFLVRVRVPQQAKRAIDYSSIARFVFMQFCFSWLVFLHRNLCQDAHHALCTGFSHGGTLLTR